MRWGSNGRERGREEVREGEAGILYIYMEEMLKYREEGIYRKKRC